MLTPTPTPTLAFIYGRDQEATRSNHQFWTYLLNSLPQLELISASRNFIHFKAPEEVVPHLKFLFNNIIGNLYTTDIQDQMFYIARTANSNEVFLFKGKNEEDVINFLSRENKNLFQIHEARLPQVLETVTAHDRNLLNDMQYTIDHINELVVEVEAENVSQRKKK